MMEAMWIMIAGPYSHGTASEEERRANLKVLNEYAYKVFDRGHIPIIGVNMALPIIGSTEKASFNSLMMPISLALASRCDAVLRIGGPSTGADQEVDVFKNKGLPVYHKLDDIPSSNTGRRGTLAHPGDPGPT